VEWLAAGAEIKTYARIIHTRPLIGKAGRTPPTTAANAGCLALCGPCIQVGPAPTTGSKQRRAIVCPVMIRMNIGRVRKSANIRVVSAAQRIGALASDRSASRQKAALGTNGGFDGPHRSIGKWRWTAAMGRKHQRRLGNLGRSGPSLRFPRMAALRTLPQSSSFRFGEEGVYESRGYSGVHFMQ
jgi:hypothetical protein